MFRARYSQSILPIALFLGMGWGIYRLFPIKFGLCGDSTPRSDFVLSQIKDPRIVKEISVQQSYIASMRIIDDPIIEDQSFDKLISLTQEQYKELMKSPGGFSYVPVKIGSSEYYIKMGHNTTQFESIEWSAMDHHFRCQVNQISVGVQIRCSLHWDNAKTILNAAFRYDQYGYDRFVADFPGELLIPVYHGPEFNVVCPTEPGIYAWRAKSGKPGEYEDWCIIEVIPGE